MKRKDYYKVLGVSSYADAETIKKAYRKLAMEYHPDRRPGDAKAMERFKEIAEAYGVLNSPTKRAAYDRQRSGVSYSRPYEAYQADTTGTTNSASSGERPSHRRPYSPEDEWTPPRPPRTPHARPETEGLFKYAHQVSYGAMVVFALSLACYMFWAISQTRNQEERTFSDQRNSANMLAAQTVTAGVSHRLTQQAPTRTPPLQTATFDPIANQRTLSGLPDEWLPNHHVGVVCTVELSNGESDCGGLGPISVVYSYNRELLLRIDLDPAKTEYRRVLFMIEYGRGKPTGWTVNIGDSRSNDGLGGDAGHQANNAEIQVSEQQLRIFGREGGPRAELARVENAVDSGSALAIEVGNERVRWWTNSQVDTTVEELLSPYLFALDGQADSKGGVNYQVYAAFDRVVAESANRDGSGVARVSIRLLP